MLLSMLLFAAQATAEPAEKPKLVCRRYTPVGSLISKKDCRTQPEWEKAAADGNAEARRLIEGGAGTLNSYNADPADQQAIPFPR
ncbi:hypothetical protein ACFSCW_03020 [Sphingomonas tabacisoli]|uniref:Uncharacterized protein n=1 Tax=Sphingomonas tabacisoli TaxID=2249466 RepID=A0ABW4HYP7_9SPHN